MGRMSLRNRTDELALAHRERIQELIGIIKSNQNQPVSVLERPSINKLSQFKKSLVEVNSKSVNRRKQVDSPRKVNISNLV